MIIPLPCLSLAGLFRSSKNRAYSCLSHYFLVTISLQFIDFSFFPMAPPLSAIFPLPSHTTSCPSASRTHPPLCSLVALFPLLLFIAPSSLACLKNLLPPRCPQALIDALPVLASLVLSSLSTTRSPGDGVGGHWKMSSPRTWLAQLPCHNPSLSFVSPSLSVVKPVSIIIRFPRWFVWSWLGNAPQNERNDPFYDESSSGEAKAELAKACLTSSWEVLARSYGSNRTPCSLRGEGERNPSPPAPPLPPLAFASSRESMLWRKVRPAADNSFVQALHPH